jgi:antirestriction protein ArdC
MPVNGVTGKEYRGANRFILMIASFMKGTDDPRWAGFSQAKKVGLAVKKGEKGTLIWVPLIAKDKITKEERLVGFRYDHVFHASQLDGDLSKLVSITTRELPNSPIPACEEWIARLNPKMMTGVAAAYMPKTDTICMPPITAFDSAEKSYFTLLHELGHWTGHESRCNRELSLKYGSEAYGAEELVAEIFSLFAGYELGLEVEKNIPDSAAYIKGWMKSFKENPNWVPMACAAADKALRFCLKGKIEMETERHEETEAVA